MQESTDSRGEEGTGSLEADECYCPADGIVELLGRKHAIQVICVVDALEPVRYGEIETALDGASSSTLSNRLQELTGAAILDRTQYDDIPPRVEYRLTDDGEELGGLLEPIVSWAATRESTV